jgi:hypothetical protein
MANSLMELYGGGMVGNRTNYQLGGRVAASRRGREYAGEIRRLNEAAERAQRRQGRASSLGNILGTVGSIAGSLIPIPGVGTAVGAAIGSAVGGGLGRLAGESTYQGTKVEGGKYAQQSRRNLQGSVDDFKSSIGERALGQGLRSGLSTFISQGGADYLKAKFGQAQPVGLQAPEELLDININQPITDVSERVRQSIRPDTPISMDNILMEGDLNFTDLSEITDTPLTDFSYDDLVQYGTFQGPTMDFMPAMRGGGMVNMMPKYEYGGFVKEAEKERFDAMNRPTSFGNQPNSAGENRGFMPPPPVPPTTTFTPPAPPASPYVSGYGTATDVQGALSQLGMEDIYNDPRFAEYAGDLPDFQMGYAQQVGDIYAGGQQAARGMRAQQRQAAGQRGFAGSGIGQRQAQQAFGDLTTDIARQRRGVVEGFQADLLSAIGDIEAKGQFEFGSGPTSTTEPADALKMIDEARALANSDNPAERLRGQAALQQLKNQGYNVS